MSRKKSPDQIDRLISFDRTNASATIERLRREIEYQEKRIAMLDKQSNCDHNPNDVSQTSGSYWGCAKCGYRWTE